MDAIQMGMQGGSVVCMRGVWNLLEPLELEVPRPLRDKEEEVIDDDNGLRPISPAQRSRMDTDSSRYGSPPPPSCLFYISARHHIPLATPPIADRPYLVSSPISSPARATSYVGPSVTLFGTIHVPVSDLSLSYSVACMIMM